MKLRDHLAMWSTAFVAALLMLPPQMDRLDGFTLDSFFWLRQAVYGPKYEPSQSSTVVIALDEETYRRPPFQNLPRVMWTKHLGRVINSVVEADAKVIGFDVIFPTSVERYIRNFDRELRIALFNAAKKNKVVLGKVQHQTRPIGPERGQSIAVGNKKNIRTANALEDGDGVIRHMPLTFEAVNVDGTTRIESSLALELAARALGKPRRIAADKSIFLGDYAIPGSSKGKMTLNFNGGAGAVPTYSFADLAACSAKKNTEFFAKHFAGKVILIGSVLDVEDRKLTSKRFITESEGVNLADRCHFPVMEDLYRKNFSRDSIPGVFIHATVVNNLIKGDALRELSRPTTGFLTFALALLVALATMLFSPMRAAITIVFIYIAWTGIGIVAFRGGTVLPLYDTVVAGILTFGLLIGYRFAVSDKDKRYIRKVFSYYLPPEVIEKMTSDETLPQLGGEAKVVTILFSDIAKFSTLSEPLNAAQVATFLNEYLTEMSDIIEDHDGFIEKFVADEITAVFGAPMDDPDHAQHAIEAGLACRKRLAEMKGAFGLPADQVLFARIGVNTGEMLVGNIGSYRRFSYSAMGDAANLGSRLEGANKFYDSAIMVGEETWKLAKDLFVFREVDSIYVMGRESPVRTFEPFDRPGEVAESQLEIIDAYSAALAVYRNADFAAAAEMFSKFADRDPTAAVMVERCRHYLVAPPEGHDGGKWDGSFTLPSK